ncbi:MAG TPA: hypothetical protein VIY56_01060 [Vicinamibacterales bacterium]
MTQSSVTRVGASLAVGTLLLGGTLVDAQRRRADNGAQGAPVATNTIARNPEAYYGKLVTVSAGVEQVLSKTVFVVDQQKAAGTTQMKAVGSPVLVVAPYLAGQLAEHKYLLIRGQVVKFEPEALARAAADYTLDISSEALAAYQGLPVLVATSVVDSKYKELSLKPAPSPTEAAKPAATDR